MWRNMVILNSLHTLKFKPDTGVQNFASFGWQLETDICWTSNSFLPQEEFLKNKKLGSESSEKGEAISDLVLVLLQSELLFL